METFKTPPDSSTKHEMSDFLEKRPPESRRVTFLQSKPAAAAALRSAPAQMFGPLWDSNSLRLLEARW